MIMESTKLPLTSFDQQVKHDLDQFDLLFYSHFQMAAITKRISNAVCAYPAQSRR